MQIKFVQKSEFINFDVYRINATISNLSFLISHKFGFKKSLNLNKYN